MCQYTPQTVGALILAASLSACSMYTDTTFTEYRGPSDFRAGSGTVRTVEGIDIWETGTPNRPFRVLGTLDQSHYRNASVWSRLAADELEPELIEAAKARGADALVAIDRRSDIKGYSTTFGSTSASTTQNRTDIRRFAVVQYLD